MLFQCIDLAAGTLQVLTFGLFDIFSLELFLLDIQEHIKRPLRNLYELDSVGQRKLVFCAAIYIAFVLIVNKIFSPPKKTQGIKLK